MRHIEYRNHAKGCWSTYFIQTLDAANTGPRQFCQAAIEDKFKTKLLIPI
jgi:hypothetical protein